MKVKLYFNGKEILADFFEEEVYTDNMLCEDSEMIIAKDGSETFYTTAISDLLKISDNIRIEKI